MTPLDSALIGFPLIAAGAGSIAWGYRRRRVWERGEDPPPERNYSFRAGGRAPGAGRLAIGIALIFVGIMMLAPFVASL